ncbi:Glutamate Aspartate transport system permease protein GltK [Caballeronia sordidicola]|uniref:Glutamate Aspartate transport system permease protein GltK n=1 Tax=Caballeronia sordidicola TaxID=196367 RepID=A0A242MVG1_CABSO|nr:Glutamate Aspartate transport system permease protein GltK [Caballeronia sordidicola]
MGRGARRGFVVRHSAHAAQPQTCGCRHNVCRDFS